MRPPQSTRTAVDPHRLPDHVVPSHYDLALEPDIDAASFSGRCVATIEVREATDVIVVNAAELDITDAVLDGPIGRLEPAIVPEPDLERVRFELAREVPPGEYRLTTTFSGALNDKLAGFYRSTFTDDDGVEHTIATTQFESTYARLAFPCWDEPELKAVFEVTLIVDAELLAISCSNPVGDDRLPDGRRRIRFAPTMPLSTYLLAFVVGPMEATDPVDIDGVPLRIVHPIGKGHLTEFALEAGAFALRHQSQYFGLPYPGDKLDLVAIPDFAFGAMENMGCATFREILLVIDPDRATRSDLERASDVIAHEIAHMWFGDLVTMKWWNGIWLKEAFATFMEMHTTAAFRPEWDRWASFGQSRSAAFDVDALDSTRAIEYPVESPDDAEGMYDLLTYEKGAAVVRMLEQYLGEDRFRDGIRLYLERHQYGNTETHDLWDAIEDATSEPTRRTMDSWIFHGGHPVVTLDRTDERTIRLRQRRFRYDDAVSDESWTTPLVVTVGTEGSTMRHRVLLEHDAVEVEVGPHRWALLNTGADGFFRSAYDQVMLDALVDARRELAAVERFTLVDDAWATVVAGTLAPARFLTVTERFGDEDDLSVWMRILGAMGALDHYVTDEQQPRLAARIGDLARPALDRLGRAPAEGDSERTRDLRGGLISALGTIGGDPDIVAFARDIDGRDDVDPPIAAAALRVLAANGGADDFADLLGRMRTPSTPQEERRLQYALTEFPDAQEIEALLGLIIGGEIRSQDAPYLLGRTMGHRRHGVLAWDAVKANWVDLNERFPKNSIPPMLEGVRSLSYPELAEEAEAFIAEHPVPQGELIVAQHLERQRVNVALRTRVVESIGALLG